MKISLIAPRDSGVQDRIGGHADLEVWKEDEFEGAELLQLVIDTAKYIPIAAGSLAVTLASINKSIEELRKLSKEFLPKSKAEDRAGVFEAERRVLDVSASEDEIDAYFDNLKRNEIQRLREEYEGSKNDDLQ